MEYVLTGALAAALERNRNLSLQDMNKLLHALAAPALTALRDAGMPESSGPTAFAPYLVAQHAQDYTKALGSNAEEEHAAAQMLAALAVLHDARGALDSVETETDLDRAAVRLVVASITLGTLDAFKVISDDNLFDDAAIRQMTRQEQSVGGKRGGRASAKKRSKALRNQEIRDAYQRSGRKLTQTSWAQSKHMKAPWKLHWKTVAAILREGKPKKPA